MANQLAGKALSEIPALKPYRGKLAVRNFRGDDGNVGIIRSPISAIVLPDNGQTLDVPSDRVAPLFRCFQPGNRALSVNIGSYPQQLVPDSNTRLDGRCEWPRQLIKWAPPRYSYLKATIGSTREARRAGM